MNTIRAFVLSVSTVLFLGFALVRAAPQEPPGRPAPNSGTPRELKPQTRPKGQPIDINPAAIAVDDGDTVTIRWNEADVETVRILGIDSPETRHDEHGIPLDQSFGSEARAFAQGAFATTSDVKLIRSSTLDPYSRTLGYLFLNGKNYSALIIRARLAEESVSFYGDNGLPQQAAEVIAAAKASGPPPFEPPHLFRKRMRTLSEWSKNDKTAPQP